VQAVVGATMMVVCIISFSRETRFSPHDIVHYGRGPKAPYMERWQAEAIYVVCTLAGATLLGSAIQDISKRPRQP
jgi:multisubunit Na+/H+ antiporter MnhB subunit